MLDNVLLHATVPDLKVANCYTVGRYVLSLFMEVPFLISKYFLN